MLNDSAKRLECELEQLRQDRKFMLENLREMSISDFLGLGFYSDSCEGGVWKKWPLQPAPPGRRKETIVTTAEEALAAVNMRKFLQGVFWWKLHFWPQGMGETEGICDDDFWLDFLQIGKANNWRAKDMQQAILASEPPRVPQVLRVAAWFFFLSYHRSPDNSKATKLPAEAFELLDHFDFSGNQKKRWDLLLGFGLESMFKNRQFSTNMATNMSSALMSDWFSFALTKRRSDIVCYWLQEYPVESLGVSLHDVMLYVAANYHGEYAVKVINCLEKLSPGICAGFCDRHGNNLLWYTAPCWQLRSEFASAFTADKQRRDPHSAPGKADEAWRSLAKEHGDRNGKTADNWQLLLRLIKLGISPDKPNHYGFCFRDLDEYAQLIRRRWKTTRFRKKSPQLPSI